MVVGPPRSSGIGGEEGLLEGGCRVGKFLFQEGLGEWRMIVVGRRAGGLQEQVFRVTVAIPERIVESIDGIKVFASQEIGSKNLGQAELSCGRHGEGNRKLTIGFTVFS